MTFSRHEINIRRLDGWMDGLLWNIPGQLCQGRKRHFSPELSDLPPSSRAARNALQWAHRTTGDGTDTSPGLPSQDLHTGTTQDIQEGLQPRLPFVWNQVFLDKRKGLRQQHGGRCPERSTRISPHRSLSASHCSIRRAPKFACTAK